MKINHTFTISVIADSDISAGQLLHFIQSRMVLSEGLILKSALSDRMTIKKISSISAAREPRPDLVPIRHRWSKMRYRNLFVREDQGEFVVRVAEADPEDPYADLGNVILRTGEMVLRGEAEAWAKAPDDVPLLLAVIDEKDDAPASA